MDLREFIRVLEAEELGPCPTRRSPDAHLYMVMEFCDRGTLKEVLFKDCPRDAHYSAWRFLVVVEVLIDVAEAVITELQDWAVWCTVRIAVGWCCRITDAIYGTFQRLRPWKGKVSGFGTYEASP